jgi:hypothetical protein
LEAVALWRFRCRGSAPPAEPPARPPIERIAADLRRLSRRLTESQRWGLRFAAAQQAYDHHLMQACAALGVEEHLADVTGVDHEIERVRVEGELQQLGLELRMPSIRHAERE